VTGWLLAGENVFMTVAGDVVAYDSDELKLYVLNDPVEDLRGWLDRDKYIEAVSALGLTPVLDPDDYV
jgi:hypothetical protein